MNSRPQNGYAIVSTVLVLCVVIVVLAGATAARLAGQLTQGTQIVGQHDAQRAAEACAELALQRLRTDAGYDGNETTSVGSSTCTIKPVTTSGSVTTIQTEATVDGHPYRLQITLSDVSAMTITSWKHVTAF